MKILGFNCYGHDSAAVLIEDGVILAAIEEERLNRKKHSGAFPVQAIKKILEITNTKFSEIDHIGFSWDPKITFLKAPIYVLNYWKTLPTLIRERKDLSMEETLGMLNHLSSIIKLPNFINNHFLINQNKSKKPKFHFLKHHLCHAASTFYPSGFKESAILTIDGAGEWATAMMLVGNRNKPLKVIRSVDTPYSLGAFYQAISRYLGFSYGEGPGKLMGLASYGKRNSDEYKKLKNLFTLNENGTFKIDMSYFSYHYSRKKRGVSDKFISLFGEPHPDGELNWTQKQLNIASGAQQVVEDVIFHMVKYLKEYTKSDNLCLAGGVALNSVTNGLLAKSKLFKNIFVQPAAGDSGTSIGSALLIYHDILKLKSNYVQKTSFLGNEYSNDEYKNALKNQNLKYVELAEKKLYENTVKVLKSGAIVAWHNGRMEFGPRALGNRSFFASPLIKNMKDTLNKRVKFREGFRPFAAIVTEEDVGKYFDFDYQNPYMLFVFKVKKQYREILPAITHVDNTVRIQTVSKDENLQLYKLLKEFEKQTGYPILINTSFNIKGEPIVCSPEDAVNSFKYCDVDYLIMSKYFISK